MTSREHIRKIINREKVDTCGFWIGKPQVETMEMINKVLGTDTLEEIQVELKDDIRWITPQYFEGTYSHPDGNSMRPWKVANPHGMSGMGPLCDATSLEDFKKVAFPEVGFLDFTDVKESLKNSAENYILSGFWSPFYHDLTYLFGTTELMIKMMMEPEIVNEALVRICGFYLEANELFFKEFAGQIDALFIGNDFGTQNGLMFSPELFREFYLPWIVKFADQAHKYGLHFVLHSCGGIADVIDDLIGAGVDCLHPLQTTARGMSPAELSAKYHDRITFMGGVDTQNLLLNGSSEEIDSAVELLLEKFGTDFILGPSHEALLPTIKVDNVIRMANHDRHNPADKN